MSKSKVKRLVYRVRWSRPAEHWVIVLPSGVEMICDGSKRQTMVEARAMAREAGREGETSQLVIHNKNGRIQRGDGEATYPRSSDPKRFKG